MIEPQSEGCAINFTALPEDVAELVRDSLAPNSRRAYASDLSRFLNWGGTLPSTSETIARYLAQHADSHAAATLTRWLTSLSKAHRTAGLLDPTRAELVRSVLRGVLRTHGSAPIQAKPLLRDDLLLILDAIGRSVKDIRDRALLLVGFAGGFRRSELVALDHSDVEWVRQGAILHIRRSKTDQLGHGRRIGIPLARGHHCAVAALEAWVDENPEAAGPLFGPVNRHGHISDHRLSGEAVSLILKARASNAGLDADNYSGHSLRSGFATSAAQAGIASWKIRKQTGHTSDAMLSRYIRDGELFVDNAVSALL